jgi:CubicO group peptidase (beta-lactamase class C family)
MRRSTLHLSQSVAKSVTSTVAGILVGRGLLDPQQEVCHYLPELGDTGWRAATLRQVLDMTTGVRYVENYEALDSDIAVTDVASGWKTPAPGRNYPACIWDQILTLTDTDMPHGQLFRYRSIETDVLAHCMERVTGTRLAELISRELWKPMGAERSASFTVDRAGYPLADGGFNACLRDYARLGLLHLNGGFANGRQIVPAEWIDDIFNADPTLFGEPYNIASPLGAYRNQFWVHDLQRGIYMARGVFGQLIYVDRSHGMVAVKLSSWPEFISVPRLIDTLQALERIGQALNSSET